MREEYARLIAFIREQFASNGAIPLHAPTFDGNERRYVEETITSTFVSTVGAFVGKFEEMLCAVTRSPSVVATVNGTAALHAALLLAGVQEGDAVLTQSLTFVAGCNAIVYAGAIPIFIDVDRARMSLCPKSLEAWLDENAFVDDQSICRFKKDRRRIAACLPMHTFGHPADLDGLIAVCGRWCLRIVEDAAEALGSLYKGRHVGTFGELGTLSFNGNKIVTTGGGGAILASRATGEKAKHLTTTAKIPHAYEFFHDQVGFNYRLPNLNAALGCAQLEELPLFLSAKRALADGYDDHLRSSDLMFVKEPSDATSNYWLNAVVCPGREARDELLKATNAQGVGTRPIWCPMHTLPAYRNSPRGPLDMTEWLADRVVNLPSSVPAFNAGGDRPSAVRGGSL